MDFNFNPVCIYDFASKALDADGFHHKNFKDRSSCQGAVSSDAARCFWAAATLRWQQEEFLAGANLSSL